MLEVGCVISLAEDRGSRAARNQSLFREINERVRDLNEGFSMVLPVGEWICECANDTCTERIEMSPEAYEAIRQDGARFFVAPSDEHILADSQRITERHERFWVVEKTGEPRELAKRADPALTRRGTERPAPLAGAWALHRRAGFTRQTRLTGVAASAIQPLQARDSV